MLNKKGQRELAYVVKITSIAPIADADRIELAHVNGWQVVVKKDEFKVGDLVVYFEIDSKLPETETFEFMSKYKYRVKTQRLRKVLSQGLIISLAAAGLEDAKEGDFVTEKLGVTYYEPQDNERKADSRKLAEIKADKFIEKWSKKHKFLSKFTFVCKWRRKRFIKKYFASQKKKKTDWPFWVKKTDEERIQNLVQIFDRPEPKEYWVTEKIDGTSTTFTMLQAPRKKRHVIICSRNVVFNTPEKEDRNYYKDTDGNVYIEMFEKYDINKILNYILDQHPEYEYITLQGETYGGTIQKRKYCDDHRFALFNYIYKENGKVPVRLNPSQMNIEVCEINKLIGTKLETVPILGSMNLIGYNCDKLLAKAEGKSVIDGLPREGLVFRDMKGEESFKAVSNSFLEKYHG